MKRSLSGMADLAVLSAEGVRLGAVHDAYVDPSEQRVVGFSIDWDEELLHAGSETDFLPLTQMVELTADVLSVGDELGESEGLAHDFSIDREGLLKVFEVLIGRRVHDADGACIRVGRGEHVTSIDPRVPRIPSPRSLGGDDRAVHGGR